MKIKELLGLSLLGLIPLGAFASCDPMRSATPGERSELVDLDRQREEKKAEIELSEAALKAELAALRDLTVRAATAETPEEAAAIQAEVLVAMKALEASTAAWEVQLAELDAIGERQTEIEGEAGQRQVDAASGLLGAIDPRLAGAAAIFGPLVVRLGSGRSRRHLKDAAQKALKLGIGDALSSLVKAYGFTHTDETSRALTERAAAAAHKEAATTADREL